VEGRGALTDGAADATAEPNGRGVCASAVEVEVDGTTAEGAGEHPAEIATSITSADRIIMVVGPYTLAWSGKRGV
jgi:hypothetical protein